MIYNYIFVNGKKHRISGFILKVDLDRIAMRNNIVKYTAKGKVDDEEITMDDLPYDGDVEIIDHTEPSELERLKKKPEPSIQDLKDRIDKLETCIEGFYVLLALNIALTVVILLGVPW